MKNENKIHLLSVPAFKDQWTENVGGKNSGGIAHQEKKKNDA